MRVEIKATKNFYNLLSSKKRYVWLLGGVRSGKTYSALQYILYLVLQYGVKAFVIRKTFPALVRGTLTLFQRILDAIPVSFEFQKRNMKYVFGNDGEIWFFSLDNVEKIKGAETNILFVDEMNEFSYDEYLFFKTRISASEKSVSNKFIFASNPVMGWMYEKIYLTGGEGGEVDIILSTPRDNPFLSYEYLFSLEKIREVSEETYRYAVLGEFVKPQQFVFQKINITNEDFEPEVYGVDFGYVNPSVVVGVKMIENNLYIKEIFFQSYTTNSELISFIKNSCDISKMFFCDGAEPQRIEEMKRAGIKAVGVKEKVKDGIHFLISKNIFIYYKSKNTIDEFQKYSFVKKDDIVYDEFVKMNDHSIDAVRYATFLYRKKANDVKFLVGGIDEIF